MPLCRCAAVPLYAVTVTSGLVFLLVAHEVAHVAAGVLFFGERLVTIRARWMSFAVGMDRADLRTNSQQAVISFIGPAAGTAGAVVMVLIALLASHTQPLAAAAWTIAAFGIEHPANLLPFFRGSDGAKLRQALRKIEQGHGDDSFIESATPGA